MPVSIVFETHSTSEDNERRLATGWAGGRLSATGRGQAEALGQRRRDNGIAALFASDLNRAVETARIAIGESGIPLLLDWRLRECDYGELTRMPAAEMHANRHRYIEQPYPGGESWRQAVTRVARFLDDLPTRWQDTRVLIIGHIATRWGLDHVLGGRSLDDLVNEDFAWREGWEYQLG